MLHIIVQKFYRRSLNARFTRIATLVNDLTACGPDDDMHWARHELRDLVRSINFSRLYFDSQTRIAERAGDALRREDSFAGSAAKWDRLPNAERRVVVEDYLGCLAATQESEMLCGVKAARLREFNDAAIGKQVTQAEFSLDDRDGRMDIIDLADDGYLETAIAAASHEQTHILQVSLARAVHFGMIRPTHPLYYDGMLTLAGIQANAYVPMHIDGGAHVGQAIERDASRVDSLMAKATRKLPAPEYA